MNKITGIIVGGVLLLAVGGFLVKKLVFPSSDSATIATTTTGFMDVLEPTAKITDVLDAAPSGTDDAGKYYAQAVEILYTNYDAILDATADLGQGKADGYAEALKMFEEIRAHIGNGAKQANMNYLAKHASGKLQVSKTQKIVERLGETFEVLDILGDYYIKNNRYKDADALYRDMLVAGWHMVQAHSHMHMTLYGVDIQSMALDGMSKSVEKDLDKTAKFERRAPLHTYLGAIIDFKTRYDEKSRVFHNARLQAGDMWNIAENDKDRAWRVQAILGMGMMRFTHTSKTNTARNNAMIEKFLKSGDPVEKLAAQAAKAYTETEFNTAGMDW
ncbi:MAG: hypothetical protein QGH60_21690 [Phycisphaerae bacterium]|jgi:hypothetical protein|nr:hypothetical protein [Phycisphaerae bacterium]